MSDDEYPLVWKWSKLPDRVGKRCRRAGSEGRGQMRYEFPDGHIEIAPGFAAYTAPPGPEARMEPEPPPSLEVELPGGGKLELANADEVVMWNTTQKRYIADYKIQKANDLVLLGSILSQILVLYRAQRNLQDPAKAIVAQTTIIKATTEIRAGEKALGVDRAGRERSGGQNVADYIERLKKAAYAKGVHISARVLAYERVCTEARWKIRLLRNGDIEDQGYHHISDKTIVDWLEGELAALEIKDQEWAKEQGAVFVGRL